MENIEFEKILTDSGIKPTSNRFLVLKALSGCHHPLSLSDLEETLYPMDKSSIFRVLELFAEREVVHVIEDGSRSLKYELCRSEGHHTATDGHAHFYCEKCGVVLCLDSQTLPNIEIPEGYELHSVNFMLKGLCPKCRR